MQQLRAGPEADVGQQHVSPPVYGTDEIGRIATDHPPAANRG